MSDLSNAIRGLRSIRKYQAKAVPLEVVEEVLEAARWAPSAHNAQPWRFIVLDDTTVKRQLAEDMAEAWAVDLAKENIAIDIETRKMRVERFASAPVLVLACITMEGMRSFSDVERQSVERDLAVESLGAALQNLLLAAFEKGLGACWFCAPGFCKDTVRKVLKIPSDVEPHALILIGYPAEKPIAPPRKAINEYVFKNYWGTKFT